MAIQLSPEPKCVAFSAAFTGLIRVQIILNRLREMGVWKALSNPEPDVRPHANRAYRMAHAHRNAIENLVVFAPLAVIVHVLGAGDTLTATAAAAFCGSRLAHVFIYTFGIPLLRTNAFLVGFGLKRSWPCGFLAWRERPRRCHVDQAPSMRVWLPTFVEGLARP